MAAPKRHSTTTVIASAGTVPAGTPSTTLAQWLVNVNEDDEIRRYANGIALWREIGDAQRRAVVTERLEIALRLLDPAA